MPRLTTILLCILCVLIGWHAGWHVRGLLDYKEFTVRVEQKLNEYLEAAIASGLFTVNDDLLYGRHETNSPATTASGSK